MRVLISIDMEGIAGVVDWNDTIPGRPDYGAARELMTNEASAAVRGVLAFDPDAEVLVADAHGPFRNLLPGKLDRRARLLRGYPRVDSMMAGLRTGIDAALLIGYHGKAGTASSVLAHTMNGAVIYDVRCNGRSFGEIGLNIAHAAALGATTVLVSGDDTVAAEAASVAPGIHTVEVKRAISGWAADNLHPDEACDRIEAAVPAALAAWAEVEPLRFDGPVELEIDFIRPLMVEPMLLIPGVERHGQSGVRYQAEDFTTATQILELAAILPLSGD